jgi:hypothetical protein
MKTLKLQQIGETKGIEAGKLKAGDVTIWNFGHTEKIIEILKETPKTILVKIQSESGNFFERRLNKKRIVGIK